MAKQTHIDSENTGVLTGLFDLVEKPHAPILVRQSLLFSAGAQLIASTLEMDRRQKALVHLPREALKFARDKLPFDGNLSSGELFFFSSDANGALQYKSAGQLPSPSKIRREFLAMLFDNESLLLVLARPSPDNDGLWQVRFSESQQKNFGLISQLSASLDSHDVDFDETGLSESIALTIPRASQAAESGMHRILKTFLTEIGRDIEPRNQNLEKELKWLRTLNLIQNAVGWELDGARLNTLIARAMKQSVGYDYLELQIINQTDQKFEITNSFQHNCTAFGGPLLTVILHPDRQDELLRSHKPVILNEESVSKWLMNPRLMSMMELTSGALIPLVYQRRPNGLLKLFSHRQDYYSLETVGRLAKIGKILAKSLENARMHALMHRMATMDGLTNVYNHRFFAEQILREFKRAQRYKNRLSLLMLDIDYFKQYNDNNGHLQGDAVLTTIGKLLKSSVREVDLVCRYGGEEFVVILPETEIGQAGIVAEKIRLTVEEFPFKYQHRQPNGKVTVSIGVAEGVDEIESPTELINRADLALYRAKKLGRNRCEVY